MNSVILSDSNLKKYSITEDQWVEFIKIQDFLFLFKEVTTIMSSSSYPTLSITIPLYNILIDHIEDHISEESNDEINEINKETEFDINSGKNDEWNQLINEASVKYRTKLMKYYNKMKDSYLISIILNSRLKLKYFQDHEWDKNLINEIQQK